MPNYNFSQDHKIAMTTEKEISEMLFEWYDWKTLKICDNNQYDLLVQKKDKKLKIEIKEDFTCQKTGRVGLEFECRDKPSGISTSQADYYLYKVHTRGIVRYFLISTSTLTKMIRGEKYSYIVSGGDKRSNSWNFLFKFNVVRAHGKELFVKETRS